MSVDDVEAIDDESTHVDKSTEQYDGTENILDFDSMVHEFVSWWETEASESEMPNPYDAVDTFTEYYVNKECLLPFWQHKLKFAYERDIINGANIFISIALVVSLFFGIATNDVTGLRILTLPFVIALGFKMLNWFWLKRIEQQEARVNIMAVNMRAELDDLFYPNGQLSDFVNSMMKKLETDGKIME